ncbi:MAG: hypothetical protein WCK89_24850 [bacterium]
MSYVYERPRWARRDLALQLTGISENRLIGLVNEGHVRARKMDGKPKSGCVFCVPDVEEWLEKEAPKAGPFKLAGEKEGQSRVG